MVQQTIFDELLTPQSLVVVGLGVGIASVMAARRVGIDNISSAQITTEQAVTAFGIMAGVGGVASQLIASDRLGSIEGRTVPLGALLLPAMVRAGSGVVSALMLPSGR